VEFIDKPMTNFELFSLLTFSKKRLLIDSSLQHAAAAMNLPSVVVWVGTSTNTFGYKLHHNILANLPNENVKRIDSYLFDYSFDGIPHECPYSTIFEMFDVNKIFNAIDNG
jgi:hypothetical protein